MPAFPRYPGHLPLSLNPLNLRHYFLLAYWIYCRPTAFHAYLHQGGAQLQGLQGWRRFLFSWRLPAYRNLYLMAPIPLALVALLLVGLATLYVQYTILGHDSWINDIAVSADQQLAVTVSGERNLKYGAPSGDPSMKVWDLQRGAELKTLTGHGKSINAVAITTDSKFAVTASNDNTLKIWDLTENVQWQSGLNHQGPVMAVVITPDNQKIISASEDLTLKIWDLPSGKEEFTLTGHQDIIPAIALTHNGKQVVSASEDGTLKVWDVAEGKELRTLIGHQGGVLTVAISPDDQWVISGGKDQTVRVWNLATGTLTQTLTGHQGWINQVAVTPNHQQVVSAANDNTLKVWDITTGELLHTLTGHQGWVNAVAITPNGERAISASSDQQVKVWDLAQGQEIYNLGNHYTWVTALAVVSDDQVISGAYERFPKLWDIQAGREIAKTAVKQESQGLQLAMGGVSVLLVTSAIISLAMVLALGVTVLGVAGGVGVFLGLSAVAGAVLSVVVVFLDRVVVHPAFQAVAFGEFVNSAIVVVFGLGFGMTFGVAFGLNSRKSLGVFASVLFTVLLGIAAAVVLASVVQRPAGSLMGPLLFGQRIVRQVAIGFNILVVLGALRMVLYPLQFAWAFWSQTRGQGHPLEADELVVLPLPGTRRYLCQRLQRDQRLGLAVVTEINRNPFQRSIAQAALQTYLHQSSTPLHLIYEIITDPDFDAYLLPPVAPQDWQLFPTARQVLLGQLGNQWVGCSGDWPSYLTEKWVGFCTAWCRVRRRTALTAFARMLYELKYEKDVQESAFDLSVYQPIYGRVSSFVGGMEIADSFAVMSAFLGYQQFFEISKASYFKIVGGDTPASLIRPTVIMTLVSLQKIGYQVITYEQTPEMVGKLQLLVQINHALRQLEEYVNTEVLEVEKLLLLRIIRQWQIWVSDESSEVAVR